MYCSIDLLMHYLNAMRRAFVSGRFIIVFTYALRFFVQIVDRNNFFDVNWQPGGGSGGYLKGGDVSSGCSAVGVVALWVTGCLTVTGKVTICTVTYSNWESYYM